MGWGESEHTVVGDSKILTVSYGTFSCTLEGFDDPFSTMKAIAEYFRDLAAGDRYFGAEPPQPDTDMLQRIAEQANRSAVDAEVSENSLVLRQAETSAPAAVAAPVAAAAAVPVMAEAEVAEDAPVAEPEPVVEDAAEADAEDVAKDTAEEVVADATEDVVEEAPEDLAADAAEVADTPDADPSEELSEHAGYGQRDSIAEKLQRIRAVVSQENTASDEEAAFFNEDQHAEEYDAAPGAPQATYEAEYGSEYEDETDQGNEADGGSMLASVMARAADDADADVEEDTDDDSALSDALAALEEDTAEVEAEAEAELETEIDVEEELASEAQALSDAQIEDDAVVSMESDLDEMDEDAQDAAISERRPIKVEKISREDIEAAQSGAASMDGSEAEDGSELSADAEEELMRELAQVEAEMLAASEDDVEEDDAEDMSEVEAAQDDAEDTSEQDAEDRAARKERALQVEDEDDALNRLMDATSTRMSDDGEGAVRRASIAHLKAAVAATKADDSIAQAAADEDEREMDQYRDDLARVVRPGRAKPRGDASESNRPSPLVLVSEQRIDGDDSSEAEATPDAAEVQPRRINAGNLALEEEFEEEVDTNPFAASDNESFRAFAARHAAVELPDLLEAAAAHYAYVEQKDDFTRPMLMSKTSSINEEGTISREEGLRAFGSLLRRGRIVKRGNGKFVISETSQFTPEAREAGE